MAVPTKANVTRPRAFGYDALIEAGDTDSESLYLRLAVGPGRQLEFQTAPIEPPRVSTEENPEDMRPDSGRVFSRNDWSGGQGLDRAHRRNGEPSDFSRFWQSRGVDISLQQTGQPSRLRLLHRTGPVNQAEVRAVTQVGEVVFHTDGDNVVRAENIAGQPPTFTNEDPHAGQSAGTVLDLTASGRSVYAAIDLSGIHRRDPDGNWTHWSDLEALQLWGEKGRVIAAVEEELYEANPDDGSVLLHVLPEGNRWTDVADAGAAILAAADDGYVYAFAIDEEIGTLGLVGQTRITTEQPTALAVGGSGVVLVGTGEPTAAGGRIGRLWRFAFANNQLVAGQVLREFGTADTDADQAPSRILTTRNTAHIAVFDGELAETWAYHFDTAGLVRGLEWGDAPLVGLASVDARLVAAGAGVVQVETNQYVREGWLISPAADFFSAAAKQWVGCRLVTPTMPAGEVMVSYSTDLNALDDPDHPSWRVAVKSTPSSPGIGDEGLLRGVVGRYLIFKLTIRSSGPATPEVESVAFRAFPDPHEVILNLPVNVSDQLELPGRRRIHVPGAGDRMWEALKAIEGKNVTLTLLRPKDQMFGQVMVVTTPIRELPRRGSPTVFCQLTFRGRRSVPLAGVTSPVFGVPMFGEPLFGGVKEVGNG